MAGDSVIHPNIRFDEGCGEGGIRTLDAISDIRSFQDRRFSHLAHLSMALIVPQKKDYFNAKIIILGLSLIP